MGAESIIAPTAPYARFVWTGCIHTLIMLPRRRLTLLVAFVLLVPPTIPLMMVFLLDEVYTDVNGFQTFAQLALLLYIPALCPLIALLYGGMLIGEDIDAQTFPYIFTRPIPRSAWVLGKFLGYVIGVTGLVAGSLAITYWASSLLVELSLVDNLKIFTHFAAIIALSLAAYGALALFLGVIVKRTTVWGLLLIYGWQPIASSVPGSLSYLTFDKYIAALLPDVFDEVPTLMDLLVGAFGAEALITDVDPWVSFVVLPTATAVLVGWTAHLMSAKEHTLSRAADS
jgi:ABC-type transport system involved in multi-copper enzyme maturation permease subunit